MRMIKALAAIAATILLAACSDQQAAAPATTTVTPGSAADFRQNVGDRVFFDTDKSNIREDARTTLGRQAEWLKKYPNYQVTIEGHCDERARANTIWRSVSVVQMRHVSIWSLRAYRRLGSRRSATARSVRIRSVPMRPHGRVIGVP